MMEDQQEYDRIIDECTAALNASTGIEKRAKALNRRGTAWLRKGSYARALSDFEQALELEPHSAHRRLVLAFYLAVCPMSQHRDGNRAVKLMTEACEITDYKNTEHLI